MLLIGVFVGTQVRPSYGPADGVVSAAGGEKAAEIVEMEEAAEPEAAPVPTPDVDAGARSLVSNSADESYADSESAKTEHAEIVVLEDGQRFAIIDVFVDDEIDPGELDWQAATLEETGDACEAAMLEDGTCLVLFEDEDNLYLAIPQ